VSGGEYIVALVYLGAIAGAAGAGATVLRPRLVPGWRGSPARLVECVLGVTTVVVAAELLGLFGALTRLGLLAGVTFAAGAAWLLAKRSGSRPSPAPPPAPPVRGWLVVLALGAAVVTVLHWSGGVQDSLAAGIYRQDSAWYHLPLSAGFFQTAGTWSIHFTDPLALTAWFYPQNSELLHAVGMLVTGSDVLSPLVNLCWMALALLAGWCVGRPYGFAPATLIATALVLDSAMMQTQAGNAPTDTAGVFFLLAAIALLVNADATAGGLSGREARGALPVAALAAGLAIGAKITLLAPLAALTAGLMLISPPGSRRRLGVVWSAGLLVGGGFWYVRNLLLAGNPLPWTGIGPLPSPDQVSLYPRPPHSVADYLDDPGVWIGEFVPRLERTLGELWPLVLVAAAAGLLISLARGRSPLLRVLGGVGVFAAAAYVFIPISASGADGQPAGFETNLRYLAPALVLGLVLLPLGLPRSGARFVAPGLAGIFLVNAISSGSWDVGQLPAGLLYALVLVALPTGLIAFRARHARWPALAALAVLVLGLPIALGYGAQRDYLRSRYVASLAPPADSPGFRATPQWRVIQEWGRRREGERIGIVGPPAAYGQYVFYGDELSNHVRYVGTPGPHGAYLPIDDCVEWFQAVNRGEYDYVVVTPASALGPGPVPQETLWMGSDRAAREIVRSGGASVFRIDADLDPRSCDPDRLPPSLRVPGGGFAIPGLSLPLPPPTGGG